MSWSKLDDRLHVNPKIGEVSDKGLRLYIFSITYSSSRKTCGHLTKMEAKTVRRLAEATDDVIEELVSLRLWDKDGDGYMIHDYGEYNPKEEEIRRKRSDAGRMGGQISGQSRRSKIEANASAKVKQNGSKGSPVPVPSDDDDSPVVGEHNAIPHSEEAWAIEDATLQARNAGFEPGEIQAGLAKIKRKGRRVSSLAPYLLKVLINDRQIITIGQGAPQSPPRYFPDPARLVTQQ